MVPIPPEILPKARRIPRRGPSAHPPSINMTEIVRRKEEQVRRLLSAEGEDVVEEVLAARSAIWDGQSGGEQPPIPLPARLFLE